MQPKIPKVTAPPKKEVMMGKQKEMIMFKIHMMTLEMERPWSRHILREGQQNTQESSREVLRSHDEEQGARTHFKAKNKQNDTGKSKINHIINREANTIRQTKSGHTR